MVHNRNLSQEFTENGFILLEGFFSEAELADMENVMNRYLALAEDQMFEKGKEGTPVLRNGNFSKFNANTFNFGRQAQLETAFQAFNQYHRLTDVTKTVMGDYEDEALLVQISTRGRGQAWHRDCHYPDNLNHFMVNRLIYTRDIKPEAGALYVVPGSHKFDKLPPGGSHDPIEGEIMVAPKKGSLVLLHSSTFHRVVPNSTDSPRFSINFRIRPAGAPAGLGDIAHYRNGGYQFSTQKDVAGNN